MYCKIREKEYNSEIIFCKAGLINLMNLLRSSIQNEIDGFFKAVSGSDVADRNEVFRYHEKFDIKNLDYFYQSQIIWDETMAHLVAAFMAIRIIRWLFLQGYNTSYTVQVY